MPTSRKVYQAVVERSGGICEDCHRRPAQQMHHYPEKKMGGTTHVYTEKEVFHLCLICHEARRGVKVIV